jgi:nucleoside-triphosphate--adenylate kinase
MSDPARVIVADVDVILQEVFARRLDRFYKSTSPLLNYFHAQASTKLITLTGATSDEIWPQLDGAVRGAFPKLKERAKTLDGRRQQGLSGAVVVDAIKRQENAKETE